MDLTQASQLAKLYYKCDIPFAFEGTHGIGKSQSLESLATSLDIGHVSLNLSLCDEGDLIGALYKPDNSIQTAYTQPVWLNMIAATGREKGILCLEELNRCDRLVRQPALQILWDRKCLHWNVPKGWLPVATWNPPGEDYEAAPLDPALLSRLIILPIDVSVNAWLSWALANGISASIISFIEAQPHYLHSQNITPRHWFLANKILSSEPGPSLRAALIPLLGEEICVAFMNFIEGKLSVPELENLTPVEATKMMAEIRKSAPLIDCFLEKLTGYVNQKGAEGVDLNLIQMLLLQTPSDCVLAWFQKLKKISPSLAKRLLERFTKADQTLSLMSHLFGSPAEAPRAK